jgi:hypothetical protein
VRRVSWDLGSYRERAERFVEEIDREYYLHLAGLKPELQIEPIYRRHAALFDREAVERLRELASRAEGDERRRLRYLLQLAFEGLLGEATKAETAEIAGLEASLELQLNGGVPYRSVPIEQANEPDAARRAALEVARDELLESRLNPLYLKAHRRTRELTRALGWATYAEAWGELRGIDLAALAARMADFLEATEDVYAAIVDPQLEEVVGDRLGSVRRSDLPRFFRAPGLDAAFGAERLLGSFAETLSGLGIELEGQSNIHLDTEQRPSKSPRAFCSTPRVPEEVYLVVSPRGGREDFAALFHEGGHAQHYAWVAPTQAFEFRQLGDNSVTESFAFLLEHLTDDSEWLRARLGAADPRPLGEHARALKLVMLRRYAAKIGYELELHGGDAGLEEMGERYSRRLSEATRIPWPRQSWLADVDGGFYVACYLRAWALEAQWRSHLRQRFGERWFERAEAGRWLRGLWSEGQRLDAGELAAEALGEELSFEPLASEFA